MQSSVCVCVWAWACLPPLSPQAEMDLITGFSIITAKQAIKHIHSPHTHTHTHTHILAKLTLPCSCSHIHTYMHTTHTYAYAKTHLCTCHILDVYKEISNMHSIICRHAHGGFFCCCYFYKYLLFTSKVSFDKQREVLPNNNMFFFSS